MRLTIPQLSVLVDFGASRDFSTSAVFTGGGATIQPGAIFTALPTDGGLETADADTPNWGAAEVMFVVNTSSSTFIPGNLVQVDKNFAISAAATTANTGAPVYVCLSNFSAGNTTRQCGWVLVSGMTPITTSVAATAGAVFLGTSKNVTPTAAAGKQILNATCLVAATGAWTRSISTQNGLSFVKVARVNGLYPGLAVSGTGIPASSVISSIDQGGMGFVIGSAVGTPVNATATGTVTGTFTHTGYGLFQVQRPFVQGQIT